SSGFSLRKSAFISSSVRRFPCSFRYSFSFRDFVPYSVAVQPRTGIPFSERKRQISYPSVVPANTIVLYITVSSGCNHFSADFFCLGISHKYCGKHIHLRVAKLL